MSFATDPSWVMTSRGSAARRRGAVAAETALLMIVLMLFMFLAPRLFAYWQAEITARFDAHADMFTRASTFMDLSEFETPFFEEPPPTLPSVPVPAPPGLAEPELLRYASFPNPAVAGVGRRVARYGSSPVPALHLDLALERFASTYRVPWSWDGHPIIPSQSIREAAPVRQWFDRSLEVTLPEHVRESLGLGGE
jgi:hypothetical protein